MHPVITVHDVGVLRAYINVEPDVPAFACVPLLVESDELDAVFILFGEIMTNLIRAVCADVVDDDKLEIPEFLTQDTFNALPDIFLVVIV